MKPFLVLVAVLALVVGVRVASASEPSVGKTVQSVPSGETPLPVVVPETVPVSVPTSVPFPASAVVQAAPTPTPPVLVAVTPTPVQPRSECEITHASIDGYDAWGVYGYSTLPRGTTFTYTLTVDGVTRTVALNTRPGGMVVKGVQRGNPDGYTDDGTSVFGTTQANMPVLRLPHGSVTASVTLNGATVCTA